MAVEGFSALGELAEPGIPELSALARGEHAESARWAVLVLSQIDSEKVIPELVRALSESNAEARGEAAWALASHKRKSPDVVPALLKALEDEEARVRAWSAVAIGEITIDPENSVPKLIKALTDPDRNVRKFAIRALRMFGNEASSATTAIEMAAQDADKEVRQAAKLSLVRIQCEYAQGGIIRGPKDRREIALMFTGHEFAEGGGVILDELKRHQAKASFFLTGDFLAKPEFAPLIRRIVDEGHYLGPHSDKHLLYCAWEDRNKTLISREEFYRDVVENVAKIEGLDIPLKEIDYFVPPYEHYNREIVDWTRRTPMILINYTPGTRSNADYTGEADRNFVSSQAILDSILRKEEQDPHGLNGFLLLLHIGAGPGRADKFHTRFGELLDQLAGKGYKFVRVDELLEPKETP